MPISICLGMDLLQEDDKFFPAFKKSQLYIKLLAELDCCINKMMTWMVRKRVTTGHICPLHQRLAVAFKG